jgi:hypothetical protein
VIKSKPATPSQLPQPTQPRFGRHKTLFFARCASPAISHLLEKPFEKPGRAAAVRTPTPHASAGWKSMTF